MRVVVAPTAFKGTLGALEAAEALAQAVTEAIPGAEVVRCPIADGGDDTLRLLVEATGGELVRAMAVGPALRPVEAAFGWLPGEVAVVEMASASGLALVPPEARDAMRATSRGTGDLVAAALDRGPRRVIVGVGGSATSDGGSGIAEALGVLLLDSSAAAVGPGAEGLEDLDRIDSSRLDRGLEGVDLVIACDVDNPLLGPSGAARTFGPQKGATPEEVERIEAALERFARGVEGHTGIDLGPLSRAGAAGGAAGGMHALLGAKLEDGFEVVAETIGFDEALAGADLLLVGEGRLDRQSLAGKAPVAAARRARRLGVPVWAFAGRVELTRPELEAEGIGTAADLVELGGQEALRAPGGALKRVATRMLTRAFG